MLAAAFRSLINVSFKPVYGPLLCRGSDFTKLGQLRPPCDFEPVGFTVTFVDGQKEQFLIVNPTHLDP